MDNRILVIDDDESVRDAFDLTLSAEGYAVEVASDGDTGIAMAKANRPDLVFLDLNMPGRDGVDTLRALKEVDSSLHIYIVTAFYREFMDKLKAAAQAGLTFDVASKPLSPEQIRVIAKVGLQL